MQKGHFIILAVICSILAGCDLAQLSSATETSSTPILPAATHTQVATQTPSPTKIPAPIGAGWSEQPLGVEFQTNLQDLSTGEYVVVENGSDPSHFRYSYVGLNGEGNGPLFAVSVPSDIRLGYIGHFPQAPTGHTTWLVLEWWTKDNAKSGLVFIDLATRRIKQFDAGCAPSYALFPPLADPIEFAYSCFDELGNDNGGLQSNSGSGTVWRFASTLNRDIQSYQFPALPGDTDARWITSDLAMIHNRDGVFCSFRPSQESLNCFQSAPKWWGIPVSQVSPDGKWVFISYPDPSIPDGTTGALLPTECVEQPSLDICDPKVITPPAGVSFGGYGTEASWSLDGSKLLLLNSVGQSCPGGGMNICIETTVWIYDLEQGTSRQVLTNDRDLQLGPGPWTMDGKHFLLVEQTYPNNDWTIWRVSSDSGDMTRVTAVPAGSYDVLGLFQVP